MDSVHTWKIDNKHNNKEFTLYINNNPELRQRHLLDITKDKYTLLEKFIYDTASFHLNRLNIDSAHFDDYYIEFWCKSKYDDDDNNIYIDCDQELKKTNNYYFPLLSCVTYFTNNTNTPTFISNIDLDTYKYKNFEKQQSIMLSLPKINKQITFDGHFYHGNVALTEHDDTKELYTIYINLWNKKPKNIEYYIPKYDTTLSNKEDIITSFEVDNGTCSIKVSEDIINYKFINSLMYDKFVDTCYRFDDFIRNYLGDANNSTFVFEVDKSIKRNAHINKLKNTYGDIIVDYEAIVNEKNEFKYNRFLQRFLFNNIYSSDVCKYIINECELYANKNGGWSSQRHDNYPTTDLPVKDIPSIFGIIAESLNNTIINKIVSSYNLNNFDSSCNNVIVDIADLFVVKYTHNAQNSLEMHKDSSFFSFSILLNNNSDFEGGGTYFDDGLTVKLNQGDMVIHNSNVKHSGLPITKGVRYILVGFIDLHFT